MFIPNFKKQRIKGFTKPKTLTDVRKAEIKRMTEQGMTMTEIASELGISKTEVRRLKTML